VGHGTLAPREARGLLGRLRHPIALSSTATLPASGNDSEHGKRMETGRRPTRHLLSQSLERKCVFAYKGRRVDLVEKRLRLV
jgi:hypothetical protein